MLALKGNLTVSCSPFERTGIAGQDDVHGYQELPRVPYIEGRRFNAARESSTEDLEA